MMRVVVDGKPQLGLTADQKRGIRPTRQFEQLESVVLTAAEATEAFAARQKLFAAILIVACFLLTGLVALNAPAFETVFRAIAVLLNLALWTALFVILRRRSAAWRAALPERASGLAAAGTRIALTPTGLVVGTRLLEWPSLRIDQVEFSKHINRNATRYEIERLSLASAREVVVLDSAMIRDGHHVVGNAWQRLQPA
jgi:hypothetical protein